MMGEFPFIVSNGPKLRNDQGVRTLIRKQAMKGPALARKERNSRMRANAEQESVHSQSSVREITHHAGRSCLRNFGLVEEESSLSSTETCSTGSVDSDGSVQSVQSDDVARQVSRLTRSVISTPLWSDYEAARSKFQVDVVDLSMLTDFNVGKSTNFILAADPTRLMTLLGHSKWSYLQYVPHHYGASQHLTAATDCVLARISGILMPHKADKRLELRLYARALRSLQDALEDAAACMRSDVLCATQLLSLHELLDFTRDTAWSHHVQGSVRLVKHRTSERFETDFDKALFAAHIGPIVFDSFVNNKPCYLEDPQWMRLYQCMAQSSAQLTDRSPLAIAVRSQMLMLPGLWHDIDESVSGPGLFDNEELALLESRCHKAHDALLDWMEDYKAHCVRSSLTMPSPQELAMRRELLGIGVECLAVVKRMLIATNDKNREQLEPEAQATARSLLILQEQHSPRHSWIFTGHEVGIAQSIIFTKGDWGAPFTYASEYEGKLASRKRYMTWSRMIRSSEE